MGFGVVFCPRAPHNVVLGRRKKTKVRDGNREGAGTRLTMADQRTVAKETVAQETVAETTVSVEIWRGELAVDRRTDMDTVGKEVQRQLFLKALHSKVSRIYLRGSFGPEFF